MSKSVSKYAFIIVVVVVVVVIINSNMINCGLSTR